MSGNHKGKEINHKVYSCDFCEKTSNKIEKYFNPKARDWVKLDEYISLSNETQKQVWVQKLLEIDAMKERSTGFFFV